MKTFVPDDSSVTLPDSTTSGQRFLAAMRAKAKETYPDHLESANQYVFEKLAEEITRLTYLARSRNSGAMRERTVYTGQAPIDEG